MSDGQIFLLIFFAIYLGECVCWSPRRAVVLWAWRGVRWKVRRPSSQLGSERSGAVIGFPFPPMGTMHVVQAWPLSVTEAGVSAVTLENPNPGGRLWQGVKMLRWEEVGEVTRQGRKLSINGKKFVVAATPQAADAAARLVSGLSRCGAGERSERIRKAVADSMQARKVKKQLVAFQKATKMLRFEEVLLFVICFAVVPFAYWLLADSWRFVVVAVATWLLVLQLAVDYFRVHREFFPELKEDRWQYFFLAALVPQFAMRAIDDLGKGLLGAYHPLAVLKATLGDEEYRWEASRIYRDLVHPVRAGILEEEATGSVIVAQEFHRKYLLPEVEAHLLRAGVRTADLLALDGEELKEGAEVRCPRCVMEFVKAVPVCGDCEGVATERMRIKQEGGEDAKDEG